MRFKKYPFIAWFLKLSLLPYLRFPLTWLTVFLLFCGFSISGNLLARFPSQAVGETVPELRERSRKRPPL